LTIGQKGACPTKASTCQSGLSWFVLARFARPGVNADFNFPLFTDLSFPLFGVI
jgi:hypothetical protein